MIPLDIYATTRSAKRIPNIVIFVTVRPSVLVFVTIGVTFFEFLKKTLQILESVFRAVKSE